ncbi:MAG: FAD-dependent oxidoreductase, partial [Acidobacteria bacterium]|nr:FAD-dependent oxidoreductase [Acidobacteriota bacterium]
MRRLVPMLPMFGTALAAGLVLGAGDPGAAGGGGAAPAAEVLVEAEAFADLGGWVVDPQFMDVMGSAYLLAHGLGRPVAPARTDVAFPRPGAYRLWVRTKDWLPAHHPGRFTVVVDGKPAGAVFGAEGTGWLWQDGGTVHVAAARARVELVDMTGFEGRCDALYFAADPDARPPAAPGPAMDAWRRRLLGLPDVPPSAGEFDVVVVGGGIAGTSAAVAAARLGCRVALVQDRPVLGGNASSEVRVHTGGQPGPRIVGEINATYDRGAGDEPHPTRRYDERRLAVVEAEKNIRLFLDTRVFRVQAEGGRIASVDGRHARLGTETRFAAPLFIDSTGDGSVGAWAGAEFRVGREGRDEFDESIAPE